MRNSLITSTEIDVKIRRIFRRLSKRLEEEMNPQKASLGQSLGQMNQLPVGVKFLSSRFKKLLSYLLILHYYLPEKSVYCYMLVDLEDLVEKNEAYWLQIFINKEVGKELFLKYLELQKTMTEQQFFSGICNVDYLLETLSLIKFRFEEKLRKPKRLLRHKGYRDKGSLGSVSTQVLKREIQSDHYLISLQIQKEEQEVLRKENCSLLKDYLLEGRVLTDELMFEFKITKKGNKKYEKSNSKSSEQDYCIQRSREKVIRQEIKDRRAAEKARIQEIESRKSASDAREQGLEGLRFPINRKIGS